MLSVTNMAYAIDEKRIINEELLQAIYCHK